MRKYLSVLLAILMLAFCLFGCGLKIVITEDAKAQTEESQETMLPSTVDQDAEIPENDGLTEAYAQVIEEYKKVVEYRLSDVGTDSFDMELLPQLQEQLDASETLEYRWGCMVAEMKGYPERTTVDAFGYMLQDLNKDGSPELLWVSSDYTDLLAIFTIHAGEAKLLDCYWSRHRAVILDNGTVYTHGSSGAVFFEYGFYQVDSQTPQLQMISAYGCDDGIFYDEANGIRTNITQERFEELLEVYPMEFGESWTAQELVVLK